MDILVPESEAADRLTSLWIDLAREQREFGSHLLDQENRARIRDAIVRHILTDDLLVAVDAEILGFVMLTIERPAYHQDVTRGIVENLYVRPEKRDAGIGSRLLTAAEDRLRDRGAAVIALEVMADNDAAIRLYEREGYTPHRVELERELGSDTHSRGDE